MSYAGSDWLKNECSVPLSPLGEAVADLLGDVFLGLYHIASDVRRADWTTDRYIELTIVGGTWATWDGNQLTRLVVLAHDRRLRVEMEAVAPRVMRLRFHQRQAEGRIWERHPTMEEAVDMHRNRAPYGPDRMP